MKLCGGFTYEFVMVLQPPAMATFHFFSGWEDGVYSFRRNMESF